MPVVSEKLLKAERCRLMKVHACISFVQSSHPHHRLQMKIPQIKAILKAKNLPRTGNKADLVAIYLSNVGMTSDVYLSASGSVLLVWSGNDKYSRADDAEINLRVEREVARAKQRDVFAHMMAVTKDPSKQLPEPTPGKLARSRAVRTRAATNPARGRGKEPNKRISKTPASVFSTSLPLSLTSSHPDECLLCVRNGWRSLTSSHVQSSR
jgi:hypothetical protein